MQRRVRVEGLEEAVGRIIIPVEKVAQVRNGRRLATWTEAQITRWGFARPG